MICKRKVKDLGSKKVDLFVLWKKNEFYVTYVSELEEVEKSPVEGVTNLTQTGGLKSKITVPPPKPHDHRSLVVTAGCA